MIVCCYIDRILDFGIIFFRIVGNSEFGICGLFRCMERRVFGRVVVGIFFCVLVEGKIRGVRLSVFRIVLILFFFGFVI